jgi:hypothetical protein
MILTTYYVLCELSLGKQATRDPCPGWAFAGLLNSAGTMRARLNVITIRSFKTGSGMARHLRHFARAGRRPARVSMTIPGRARQRRGTAFTGYAFQRQSASAPALGRSRHASCAVSSRCLRPSSASSACPVPLPGPLRSPSPGMRSAAPGPASLTVSRSAATCSSPLAVLAISSPGQHGRGVTPAPGRPAGVAGGGSGSRSTGAAG